MWSAWSHYFLCSKDSFFMSERFFFIFISHIEISFLFKRKNPQKKTVCLLFLTVRTISLRTWCHSPLSVSHNHTLFLSQSVVSFPIFSFLLFLVLFANEFFFFFFLSLLLHHTTLLWLDQKKKSDRRKRSKI